MDTLKDLKLAEDLLTKALKDPNDCKTQWYRNRERHFYKTADQLIASGSKRSQFFNSLFKLLALSGSSILTLGSSMELLGSQGPSAALINGSLFSLGVASGALLHARQQQKEIKEVDNLRKTVTEYRDDRFNFGLNNLNP